MSSVDVATKSQAVTLKGSAQLVKEFFGFGINSILYQRGIYPAGKTDCLIHLNIHYFKYFLLSTEGPLVITRAYQPYTLVGPPVRGPVLDPPSCLLLENRLYISNDQPITMPVNRDWMYTLHLKSKNRPRRDLNQGLLCTKRLAYQCANSPP